MAVPDFQTLMRLGRRFRGPRWSSCVQDSGNPVSTASPAILHRMSTAENNHETTRPGGITGNGVAGAARASTT